MYSFKSGPLKGMTMERAMLRHAPRLYKIAAWAEETLDINPQLRPLVNEFLHLKKLLSHARIRARCQRSGCKKRSHWMTFREVNLRIFYATFYAPLAVPPRTALTNMQCSGPLPFPV